MKKQYSLSIENPCSEKWENFTPTSNGGFCSSCQKNVVDFTTMTDKEILDFISNSPENACGRFRNDQLSRPYIPFIKSKRNRGWQMMRTGIASLSMVLLSQFGLAQNVARNSKIEIVQSEKTPVKNQTENPKTKTISGTVVDEYGEPLPGVNIILKGTTNGTVTDLDGRFEFSGELKPGDILAFSYIGYDTKEYVISKNDSFTITLNMELDVCVMVGELSVDKVYVSKPSKVAGLWMKIKDIL
ncbi:MAG: carboxypeptidase-like regulatory domain-containing protein [Flammeovirgaceae bacterium]|nr:carboxypeptidase-like regulatory domain-containing protein [Flammeovirgaceae bacterium]